MAALPFLRSPPFPDVAPAVAAVSGAGSSARIDPARLSDLLREARVGGSFWGPRVTARTVVVAAADGSLPAATPAATGATLVAPSRAAGLARRRGWTLVTPDCDPWTLLAEAETLWSQGSEIDLVAGLLDVPVRRFDGSPAPAAAPATAVAAAAYRDPFTDTPCSAEAAIELLGEWRRLFDANRPLATTAGMTWWKRRQIARFLWNGRAAPRSLGWPAALARAGRWSGAVAAWPSRVPADARAQADAAGVPLVTVEDGFLRSKGLGADLVLPWSIVADTRGIYYRPDRPSDLEHILANHAFPDRLVARAAALRAALVAGNHAKYGTAEGKADAPFARPAGRVVLAVGQVDDDLSVRFGGDGIAGNLDFLARVRAVEPRAYIVYRPHPDVLAGHRAGDLAADAALAHVDRIDAGGSVLAAIAAVDAVHVLSSLTGFEALLRGREVVVHGTPFYAGWGLTRDLGRPSPARGRRLSLDQLVAGTMIVYPRYLDPMTLLPCPPEVLIARFAAGVEPPVGWLVRARRVQGRLRRRWARA